MTDAALSLTSSLASLLTKTAPADPAATGASATPADPFAALFAAVTGGQATTTMPMTSVGALAAMPMLPPTTALPLPVPTEAVLPAVTDGNTDADDTDTKDSSDDPLGDAIAAGATAVLALAPVMVAPLPIAPTTIPIAIDGQIASKLPAIGAAAPRAQTFKPVREASTDQPAISGIGSDPSAPVTAAPAQTVIPPTNSQPQTETDDKSGDQTPAKQTGEAKLLSAALPSETLKAVIAALNQPAASTAASATSEPAAAITVAAAGAPAVEAKARTEQQAQATQVAQQQTAPAPVRRQTEETTEPRRVGETRKRAVAADIIPVDLSQRTAETTRLASSDIAGAVQDKGDTVVQQTLSVAKDGAWLDSLTRDIVASAGSAGSAGSGNDLRFKLDPQNLGSLTVAISQSESGASIRMTADTDTTRNILLDAQPKMIADARAQGLKVSDTQVDLSNQHQGSGQDTSRWTQGNAGQNGTSQNGQNRQSSPAHQPFVSNLGRTSDADTESPGGDSAALYA